VNDIDFVTSEHAAWFPTTDGGKVRVFQMPGGGRFRACTTGATLSLCPLGPAVAPVVTPPVYDVFRLPPDALDEVPELAAALTSLGTVARLRTGNLWEAIGAAVIRQTMRVAHTTNLHREFCRAHGEPVDLPDSDRYWLFPTPQSVLALSAEQFHTAGLTVKRGALRDAATAFLSHGGRWQLLAPQVLVDQLRRIPGVGVRTALLAVVDWRNDWALYPCGDLALRTRARQAAPAYRWPTDERTFSRLWRRLTGPHLPPATLLTLAWAERHTPPADHTTLPPHLPRRAHNYIHDSHKRTTL
jgi:DNA-3-methyladenine glycosylase II